MKGYTNIKLIMDRLTRHPMLKDIPFETVVDYAVDFIRLIGTPPSFIEKCEKVTIDNYRGELPCDVYEIIQVRKLSIEHEPTAFRYSTDSFHYSDVGKPPFGRHNHGCELTYKVQGNCIFTSINKGVVEVSYRAIAVDDDGYPLIPDNSSFSKALELYIKLQWFTILFDLGKIQHPVLQLVQIDYARAVQAAHTDLIRPSLDQMEAISRMWNKLLPDTTQDHTHGYINEGTQERYKLH